jgi:ribosomal protein L33
MKHISEILAEQGCLDNPKIRVGCDVCGENKYAIMKYKRQKQGQFEKVYVCKGCRGKCL